MKTTTLFYDGTRQASRGDIFMQRFNTTHYGKRSSKYAGTILWDNLAPAMREIVFVRIELHFPLTGPVGYDF